ncbi:MAG: hypothetical protein LBF68_04335 [Christensenellaceae bacterium]|nr:hypothetical protein [Christensenellaceae bacterium]
MSKIRGKILNIFIGATVVLLIVSVGCVIWQLTPSPLIKGYENRWGINLPSNLKKTYHIERFNIKGEGERYSVFRYSQSSNELTELFKYNSEIKKNDFESRFTKDVVDSGIAVDVAFLPNFALSFKYIEIEKFDMMLYCICFYEKKEIVFFEKTY